MILLDVLGAALNNAAAEYQPDDLIDVLGLLISNLPAIIAAVAGCSALVVALRGQRKGKERWKDDRKVLDDVHKQTVNDHPEEENMRDQLDRMEKAQKRQDGLLLAMNQRSMEQGRDITGLREDVGAVREDVGGLRGELREDRGNLREFRSKVNGFIKRVHPGEDPL